MTKNIIKETADKYQEFFNFMSQEYGLTLTISEMNEILFEAQKLVNNLTIPDVVGQSEQLKCDCCNGTGMVEGDYRDVLEPCLTCNGRGTF